MKLSFALCVEIQFPEIFMEHGQMGADCVLFSAYHDAEMFLIQAQGHAACNNFWISYSVPVNASHEQPACFIGPDGTVIKSCENGLAGFVLSKIDRNAEQWDIPCKKVRRWRKQAREGEIYRPYQLIENQDQFFYCIILLEIVHLNYDDLRNVQRILLTCSPRIARTRLTSIRYGGFPRGKKSEG